MPAESECVIQEKEMSSFLSACSAFRQQFEKAFNPLRPTVPSTEGDQTE